MHPVVISASSLFITLIISCLLIGLFTFIVSSKTTYHLYRTDFLIKLSFIIVLRLILPIELPFTITWNFTFMNPIIEFMNQNILLNLSTIQIFLIIWIIGILVGLFLLQLNFRQLNKAYKRLSKIAQHHKLSEYGLEEHKNCEVLISPSIPNPMVLGFHQTICLPDIPLNDSQLKDVLSHEVQHIKNHDIFNKFILNCVVVIYWWFPPIYRLRNQFHLVLEMRADQKVTNTMTAEEMMHYTQTLVDMYALLQEYTNKKTWNKFATRFIDDNETVLKYRINYLYESYYTKKTNILLASALILLPFISNLVVLEPNYSNTEITEGTKNADDLKNDGAYIIEHQDGTYSLVLDDLSVPISNADALYLSKTLEMIKE